MIRAVWRVKSNGKIYEPGEEIPRLSRLDEEKLLAFGAIAIESAEELRNSKVNNQAETDNTFDIKAFEITLESMKRPQLTAYAEKVHVEVKGNLKNTDICQLLKEDAEKNGIDIEAFDDDSLFVFAKALGLNKITGDMDREEILSLIDSRFEEVPSE